MTNPDIAGRLGNYFPYPFAYRNSDGSAATLTSTPVGTVFHSSTGNPPYTQSGIGITVDPVAGTVTTAKPTCLVFSADGVTPSPVDDFQAFLPVHAGAARGRLARRPGDHPAVRGHEPLRSGADPDQDHQHHRLARLQQLGQHAAPRE